jgi:hypothetical protein
MTPISTGLGLYESGLSEVVAENTLPNCHRSELESRRVK